MGNKKPIPHHHHHPQTWVDELTCKPLDTYSEIMNFMADPPPWRTLCKEITPHSELKIKNMDINKHDDTYLESPETFCHFSPEADEPERVEGSTLPKVLVCHDMANGYHDDSYIDGTGQYDAYTFYNWAGIDIFCYFSHHLITIPPLSWINVAHAHGVKVIGTVITEWAEGVEFWDKILDNESEYEKFASALVAIAKTLKFEGWLLNIENKISKPEVLLNFVKHLHKLLHEEIPNAELIWYDSVTIQGHLNWQNGLTDKNRAFFESCDGLFTNYSWSEAELAASVARAGARRRQLYVGIDVWGRNFFGGGQLNTFEAVKLAHSAGSSLAIFAPAWTHEAIPGEGGRAVLGGERLDRGQLFRLRDRALWGSLWPFLSTRLPHRLPFRSCFCRGMGKKRWLYGEVLSPLPWYNLRHQQYQPNSAHGPHGYAISGRAAPAPSHRGRALAHATRPKTLEDDTVTEPVPEPAELNRNPGPNEAEAPGKPEKRKPKLSLKNLFRRAPKPEEEAAGPSGRPDESMVSMSVNLSLRRDSASRRDVVLAVVADERECLELHLDDAYCGGACIKVHGSDKVCREHRTVRLLHCDFQVEESLLVCVVTKPVVGFPEQFLNVLLFMKNEHGHDVQVSLVGRHSAAPAREADPAAPPEPGSGRVAPLEPGSELFRRLQRYMLLELPEDYVPVENAFGWLVRYHWVRARRSRVAAVALRAGLPQGPVLLGRLALLPAVLAPAGP